MFEEGLQFDHLWTGDLGGLEFQDFQKPMVESLPEVSPRTQDTTPQTNWPEKYFGLGCKEAAKPEKETYEAREIETEGTANQIRG